MKYNPLGDYVVREKGELSLAEVARRAGMTDVALGRWLRNPVNRLPPPETLEQIARGLGRPVASVERAARAALGMPQQVAALNDAQLTVAGVMADMTEDWQQLVVDVVLRLGQQAARDPGDGKPPRRPTSRRPPTNGATQ